MRAADIEKNLPQDIYVSVKHALAEDIGTGDRTAHLIPTDAYSHATVISREPAILCGIAWFSEVFTQLSKDIVINWRMRDGAQVKSGEILCELSGPSASLLSGERTALNFLQTLSGTATETHKYVNAVRNTGVKILDTRKTIPGLRYAQKYAVTCGGGQNHRMGLFDAILIKENHISAAGSVTAALNTARSMKDVPIEIEVENLQQLEEALAAGAPRILLDNFSIQDLKSASQITQGHAELEASGAITLENINIVAQTGVNFISIGSLTKHVRAIDLSMRFHNP